MSRIIEGSLEILRPISVGAVKEEEWGHGASSAPPTRIQDVPDDTELYAIQTPRDDDDESRTPHVHGEEENGVGPGEDEDSFAETTDASGSSEAEEDDSSLAGTITPYEERNEAKWQTKLELLRQYRERNGHCRVPCHYEIDGVKLGIWLSDQRVAYWQHSEGKPARFINQERIDQLKALGLDFNDTKQKREEAQWQAKLQLLRQYRERNGHCRVPQRDEFDGVNLGSWINRLRVAYMKRSEGKPAQYITQERIDQLEEIGLDFNDTKQKRNKAQWQSKLELLRQYRVRNGHCRVPHSYEIDGVKLGNWLSKQRDEYRKDS